MRKLLLGLALAGALTACQPLAPAAAPAPAPDQAATEAWFLSLPEAYTEDGVLPRASDVLVFKTADALEVPLQYDRGQVETLVWEGEGEGVAELYNQHGQLLYRVEEGEPAQTVTVGAGRHTLKIRQAASDLLTMAVPEGTTSWRRQFERLDAILERAGAASAAQRGPIFGGDSQWPINDRCRALHLDHGFYGDYAAERLPWRESIEAVVQEVALNSCGAR